MLHITKPQLFLLHFAGGNAYSYQFLLPYLSNFDVTPLELPGRGKRFSEKLITDYNDAVNDLCYQLKNKIKSSKYLIYGHSMGAYLALEICKIMESEHRAPACLIVSGNSGPNSGDPKNLHLLEQEEFIAELKKMGGVSDSFLNDKELFTFFEPILRADFAISDQQALGCNTLIDAPIFALMGSKEERKNNIENWKNFTKSSVFEFGIMDGDHFFIRQNSKLISDQITTWYKKVTATDHKA